MLTSQTVGRDSYHLWGGCGLLRAGDLSVSDFSSSLQIQFLSLNSYESCILLVITQMEVYSLKRLAQGGEKAAEDSFTR